MGWSFLEKISEIFFCGKFWDWVWKVCQDMRNISQAKVLKLYLKNFDNFFLRNYRTLFRAVVFRKKIRNFFQGKFLSLGAEKCGTRPLWNSLLILTIIIVLFFPSFFLLIVIMVIVIINIILFHNKTRF